jgi:hypothetical protein
MSNVNAAFGLRPVRHMSGGEIQMNDYQIASGYATAIYKGDVVQQTTDGTIIQAEAGNVDNVGVFAGVSYVDANGAQVFSPYWPASTTATKIHAMVWDDPMIVFQIQSDATGAAAVDVANGADWEVVAGNARTGQSATNLDVSAGLGTTGKSLRILRIVDDGVNVAGAYSIVEVLFNEHVMKGVVSGVGGI